MDALVVVDMQKDFCYEDGALFVGKHVRDIFEPLRKAIEWARGKGIPVIFTQDWHLENDSEFNMWPKHCVAGSEGAEVIDELDPKPEDYYVRKRRYSAFLATDMDLLLKELGVERLIVGGIVTNICVLHTVVDALMRGYDVVVLKDCTTALDDYGYEYGLKHMETLGAKVVLSEELLNEG